MSFKMPGKKIENALLLAIQYHKDQLRKDGEPYVIHPIMVAYILLNAGFGEDVVAAGACHDLLEDTSCTEDEIRRACGSTVCEIVKVITDDKNLQSRNLWEERKRKQIEKVAYASTEVKAVYVADKIHNLQNLIDLSHRIGKEVWKKFARGKNVKLRYEKEIYAMLQKTWDHPLIHTYGELIKKEEQIEE